MATTDLKIGSNASHQLPLYDPSAGAVTDPWAYGRHALSDIRGAVALAADNVRQVSVSDSVSGTDLVIIIDATAGDVDLTFLSAADASAKAVKIARKRSDPGTYAVNLLPAGGETLAGESSVSLLPGEAYEFIPDGTSDYIQF